MKSLKNRAGFFNPRLFQIVFLGGLLAVGVFLKDFSIHSNQIAFTFIAGVLTQYIWIRRLKIKNVGYLSAIITCFGLSLLLRADSVWAHPLAAVIAISSKFLIRYNGKHIFNPGNAAVILAVFLFPGTWVSGGQWGHGFVMAGWIVALGTTVAHRANRSDISLAFLGFYLSLVAIRVMWLGQRPEIWMHQFENGALLLFSFFMISDPKTIPDHFIGRMIYAGAIAGVSFFWQFGLFKTNAYLWALFFMSPLVPVIDRMLPAPKFQWSNKGETKNEIPVHASPSYPAARRLDGLVAQSSR